MSREQRIYSHLPPPNGRYCHAVRADNWLYISGFTAMGTPGENGDIVAQSEAIWEIMKGILAIEGGSLGDIVKITTLVTEMDSYWDVHAVRERYLGDTLPASTLFQVSRLVQPDLKIEIEATALLPE